MHLSLSRRIIGVVMLSVFIGCTAGLMSSFWLMREFNAPTLRELEHVSAVWSGGGGMHAVVGLAVMGIVALMAVAAFFIARSIAGPIQRVSRGLAESTARVASVSAQVSASSKAIADGASEQAAAIEESSASLEEMAAMTRRPLHFLDFPYSLLYIH